MSEQKIPTVVLVGRTNVGKSTLFNRLLEKPKALVSDVAGTTRDRNEGECLWRGHIIKVIDTGGLDVDFADEMERNIAKQAEAAMKQADLLLFVVDVKSGLMPQEKELAKLIRKAKAPIIMVGNKAETPAERLSVENAEWKIPGMPTPIAISALRGSSVGDLCDVIYETLEDIGKPPIEGKKIDATTVAVIGKPNVGKSTLLNAILGEERFISSPIAHTTREPNDTLVEFNDKNYVFIDTAGMRRKGKVKKAGGLEAAAVRRNERVIKFADVTLLVIDASEPVGAQEKTLAGLLKGAGTGLVVIVNKWDLVPDKNTKTMNEYRDYIAASFPFLRWAPVIFVSALTKQRVKNIFELIDTVEKNRDTILTEEVLEKFLQSAMRKHAPKRGKGPVPPKVLGLVQTKTSPPTFDLIIKAKRVDTLSPAYVRFLQNRLRDTFNLEGTPVRINVRAASSVAS